jgi:hypothetical protein
MGPYWFCLRAMAREDNNGKLETLVRQIETDYSRFGSAAGISRAAEGGADAGA